MSWAYVKVAQAPGTTRSPPHARSGVSLVGKRQLDTTGDRMSQQKIRRGRGELFRDEGPDGLIARGFLRGSGRTETMVRRSPVIGVANTWSELNPCNGGL